MLKLLNVGKKTSLYYDKPPNYNPLSRSNMGINIYIIGIVDKARLSYQSCNRQEVY